MTSCISSTVRPPLPSYSPNPEISSQGISSDIASCNGFHPQNHPSIITLRARSTTVVQLSGSFKAPSSSNGNPLVPSCGCTENVRSIYLAHTGQLLTISPGYLAGSGKSILWLVLLRLVPLCNSRTGLSSSIIQDIIVLRDAGSASLAYFYFDFRDIDKQKLHNLLPSLLIQLSARSDPCCDILSRLYSAHDRGVTKPSDKAMIECLKEMLILETQSPTYIILDALDESPITSNVPSPREEVLRFVGALVGLRLPNLHICITSRPELDIRVVLEPLTQHPVSLHDESGQMQDIIDYITSFIHSDRRMQRWREEDKDLVIKTLSQKVDGM